MAASLAGKIEAALALQSPADKLYKKWRSETHQFPNVTADKIHGVEVHEGDWESPGSVKLWTYTCDGKKEIFKERNEVDDENKTVTLVAVGGTIMEELKSYKVTFKFTPKPQGGTVGKITIEYEKLNENVPTPSRYLEFVKSLIFELDAHILANE